MAERERIHHAPSGMQSLKWAGPAIIRALCHGHGEVVAGRDDAAARPPEPGTAGPLSALWGPPGTWLMAAGAFVAFSATLVANMDGWGRMLSEGSVVVHVIAIYRAQLATIFRLAPLSLNDWPVIVSVTVIVIIVIEAEKIARKMLARKTAK